MLEPTIRGDSMTVRLVGGPYDQQVVTVPGYTRKWEIAGSPMQICRPYEAERWVPGYRHVYRLDPHASGGIWHQPLPFVYDGVAAQEGTEGAASA
jgi:hypothetical protein